MVWLHGSLSAGFRTYGDMIEKCNITTIGLVDLMGSLFTVNAPVQ
jgi:hypothetical protein